MCLAQAAGQPAVVNLSFGGLANFYKLTGDPLFMTALTNTFVFLVIQVPVMLFLALIMAAVLNNPAIRMRGLFRTAYEGRTLRANLGLPYPVNRYAAVRAAAHAAE